MTLMATVHSLAADAQDSVSAFKQGVTAQSSHALIVQGYCLQIVSQQDLVPSGNARLADVERQVRTTLEGGRTSGNGFLNHILPGMVRTCSDMDSYFNLSGSVADALLDPSLTTTQMEALLAEVQTHVEGFRESSRGLAGELAALRQGLSSQSSTFGTYSHELNVLIKGDQGELKQLEHDLDQIESKIDGCISGVVLGGLAVVGGVFLIVTGAVAGVVTAGTSIPLVVAGVAVLAAGAGATTGSAIVLANLIKEKGNLLRQRGRLEGEVRLVTAMSNQFSGLASSTEGAALAAQAMTNAWSQTHDHLGTLRTRLQKAGSTEADIVRQMYIRTATKDICDVQRDVRVIQDQLNGAQRRKVDDLAAAAATAPQTLLQAG